MTYKLLDQMAGYPPVYAAVAAPTNLRDLPLQPGTIAGVMDPVFGGGEMIFARASAGIRQYGLCVLTPVYDATTRTYLQNMVECPNTATLGRSVYVAQTVLTTGQYGWFMLSGITPINGTASVAADTAFGITAAGQVGATSAGKQILGGRVVQAGAATLVKANARGVAADSWINLPDVDGLFVGGYGSGTGVGAAAIIAEIDPIGNRVRMTVVNSAAVTGDFTMTFNNATIYYNVCAINNAIAGTA